MDQKLKKKAKKEREQVIKLTKLIKNIYICAHKLTQIKPHCRDCYI